MGPFPGDPGSTSNPDYIGIGRGETALWENPYQSVNTNLPGGANAFAQPGVTTTNSFVVTIINGMVTVTMNGAQVFSE